ncbi:MAG: prolyl oligopeptidase family serine peptidase [Gemmatimonadales bacterium]|nr:prolyl oligopeptidase family serine peptidase [Gemmatimonadales bacterium]
MRLGKIALIICVLLTAVSCFAAAESAVTDPYLWLEEVDGEKALQWVEERSAADTAELEAVTEFNGIHEKLLEIYNSSDRIPYPAVRGEWIYNFWQDKDHVRGIWRRTGLEQYLTDAPKWETVIDVDALAKAEDENWVWKGAGGLYPDYERFLITLSRGGGDATVAREFDTVTKTFVTDGFIVPEAKSQVGWKDENTLWIGTDFGEGSLTSSGYPRLVKEWKRGTALESAGTIFEGSIDDVSVSAYSMHTPEGRYDIVTSTPEFFKGTTYLMRDGKLVKLEIPEDAEMQGIFKGQLLVSLRTDWTTGGKTYPQDALLAIGLDAFLEGGREFSLLFQPEDRVALSGVMRTRNHLLVTTMDNVRGKLYKHMLSDGTWSREEVLMPGLGTVRVVGTNKVNDVFFVSYTDFLTPSSLYVVRDGKTLQKAKSTPEYFDATGMKVDQYEATSADGTKIPYFIFTPKDYQANGKNPTLLYGYGGFEISMRPRYSATTGTAWVGRGGVHVLANIRGGGEFGPKWHQAAMKEKHQTTFDDFIAVAEDLIARKVTSPKHLGIVGGSNGGLLVGACFVQRPELFGAVVCQVPLLDMQRYNKLLAGASWMAEYGNPDTEDWEYIKTWSPYHNLDEKKTYPKVFFTTSTRDDRVHPGHARKMVKKMTDMGKDVYYYENTEGGHGGAANLNQRAYMWALTYAYMWKMVR